MKKQIWKGTVLTSPVPPVMVSCGDMEESNIVTVAWTGTVNTKPPMTYISLRPSRHSYGIIKEKGEFVINLTPTSLIKKADYCGIYTGKKVNKFEKCGFTKAEATEVSAPLIDECPINLECKVKDTIPLGTHDMFLAEIVAVHVDETLVDADGKLHLEKADLTAYAHGAYYSLGKKLAPFGISVKNKKKHTRNKK
ncbi:MAG: flavin reductase family protein [Clostridia bacterium]|nr:flavin reductase family protein [Clostridia bacterium]